LLRRFGRSVAILLVGEDVGAAEQLHVLLGGALDVGSASGREADTDVPISV